MAAVALWQRHQTISRVNKSIQAYMRGDTTTVMRDLAEVVPHKQDARLQALYVRALTEEGLKSYEQGRFSEAYHLLNRAREFSPDDKSLQQLLESLTARLTQVQSSLSASRQGFLENVLQESTPSSSQALKELLHQIQKDRLALSQHLAQQSDRFQTELQGLRAELKSTVSLMIGFFVSMAVAGMGAFVVIILLFKFYLNRASRSIMDWLEYHNSNGTPGALPGPYSQKLAVIEAELVHQPDRRLAENLLGPYLDNDNPWVSARAAKVLHGVDDSSAIANLRALWETGRPEAQAASLWALAEISSPDAVAALMALMEKVEETETKKSGLRYLLRLKDSPKISPETKASIETFLAKMRDTSNWII